MLIHSFTQCVDLIRRDFFSGHLGGIVALIGSFQLKLFDQIRLRLAGHSGDADVRAVHHAVCPQIIWLIHAGKNVGDNDLFSVNLFDFHNWHKGWRAGIIDAVCNSIVFLEQLIIREADHIPCLILHAENQLAARSIGKGNSGFQILFPLLWNIQFILHRNVLAFFQLFKRHFWSPLPQEQAARPLPGAESAA